MTFKKKWLWNPLNYCPPNCTKFHFKIHLSHSNQSSPYPQEMVVEPPSITVLQIVLSFSSRSILATQTNLSLVLKKWYLHVGVWLPSNRHKTQPTNDFQEEMFVDPPSIIVHKIVQSFFSRSILATQTKLSLILKKWYWHAGVSFPSNCHKSQPTNDFQKEIIVEPPQLLSSKLY